MKKSGLQIRDNNIPEERKSLVVSNNKIDLSGSKSGKQNK